MVESEHLRDDWSEGAPSVIALFMSSNCAASSSGGDIDAYARFFNPTMGITEDPATGTAAGPLAANGLPVSGRSAMTSTRANRIDEAGLFMTWDRSAGSHR